MVVDGGSLPKFIPTEHDQSLRIAEQRAAPRWIARVARVALARRRSHMLTKSKRTERGMYRIELNSWAELERSRGAYRHPRLSDGQPERMYR